MVESPETVLTGLPPRPRSQPFLDDIVRGIAGGDLLGATLVLTAAAAGTHLAGPDGPAASAAYRTGALVAWLAGHVVLAYLYRTWRTPLGKVGLLGNRVLNVWAVAAGLIVAGAGLWPWLAGLLGTTPLAPAAWGATAGLLVLFVIAVKALVRPQGL